jgi:RNA polymerase sigma-70 factor (ECF subfamily)
VGGNFIQMSSEARRLIAGQTVLQRAEVVDFQPPSKVLPRDSDEELLAKTQTSDSEALAELFNRYAYLAFVISLRILRDRAEAEDLAQDIFLRLFGTTQSFDSSKGSARTWLVQFIYRRALNRRVYLARRHFYDDSMSSGGADGCQDAAPDTLEDEVATQVTVDRLLAEFDSLTGPQRHAVRMHIFEGASLREISEETGESVKNTRHHYYRGLERLRKIANAGRGKEPRPKGER